MAEGRHAEPHTYRTRTFIPMTAMKAIYLRFSATHERPPCGTAGFIALPCLSLPASTDSFSLILIEDWGHTQASELQIN